jgi:NitT/TauT family transport system ATP-binding protein
LPTNKDNDMKQTILDVKGVTVQFKTATAKITALWDITFKVEKGDRVIIVGESGCGKSTLLNAIGASVPLTAGEILLNGNKITKPSIDMMNVYQESDQLCAWKTVLENVRFPLMVARGMTRAQATERAMTYLGKVKLETHINKYPHELSGGMKARVAIARGMAVEPAILLLDEPFAALDPMTRRQMQIETRTLLEKTDATCLMITHDVAEAIRLATKIIVLSPHPGQVIAELQGSPTGEDAELEKHIHELLGH